MRDSIPRSESYPVGRETLDAALRSAGVEHVSLIYFLRGGRGAHDPVADKVISVLFTAAGHEAIRRTERLDLRVYSVPSSLRRSINVVLESHALDRVAEWMGRAERSVHPWRGFDHALVLRWVDDGLRIKEYEGSRSARVI